MNLMKPQPILRKLLVLSFISTVATLQSCSTRDATKLEVELKDAEFCGDMGTQGATCFHTFSPLTEDIPAPQWDDVRFGMLCTTGENFANMKADVEKLCSETGSCTVNMKAGIKNFFQQVQALKLKAQTIKGKK